MTSSKELSLERLQLIISEATMTLPDKAGDLLSTLLSAAHVACTTSNEQIRASQFEIVQRCYNGICDEFDNGAFEDPPEDPFYVWLRENPEEAEKHQGKIVVVDKANMRLLGIIASGDTHAEVEAQIKDRHDRGLLCFECIPEFGSVGAI